MKISKQEFKALWAIEEGMSDLDAAYAYTGIPIEKLKKIYEKLERLGLIILTKKFDNHYKKDYWDALTTDKAKDIYKKYLKWIPKI